MIDDCNSRFSYIYILRATCISNWLYYVHFICIIASNIFLNIFLVHIAFMLSIEIILKQNKTNEREVPCARLLIIGCVCYIDNRIHVELLKNISSKLSTV